VNFDFFKNSQRSGVELTVFAAVAIIIFILAVIKVLPMFGKVEKTYFENTLKNIRLVINIHAGTQLLKGQPDQLIDLVNGNPFSLVNQKHLPATYKGELNSPDYQKIDGYSWFFDTFDHTLVYVIENHDYFSSLGIKSSNIKFKLILKFADKDKNGVFNKGLDTIQGLLLIPQDHIEWLEN